MTLCCFTCNLAIIAIESYEMDRIELVVRDDERKKRLEDLLFDRFGGLSKMYLRARVRDGKCEVNGRFENVGYRLSPNDYVEIELDLSRENSMRPQELPLDILFEDQQLIVINKPTEMLVHPTNRDKSGTLLNALSYHFNKRSGLDNRDVIRPGLVHRLDKGTSGVMVIAKTARAHRSLSAQFQKKYVQKRYLALVAGIVREDVGEVDDPIGRFAEEKRWNVMHGGKPALTKYRVRERFARTTLLELEPITGRTNQLRIHSAHIGHPIVGDTARGGMDFVRLCLHAFRLSFWHPVTKEALTFESGVPESFGIAISANGLT